MGLLLDQLNLLTQALAPFLDQAVLVIIAIAPFFFSASSLFGMVLTFRNYRKSRIRSDILIESGALASLRVAAFEQVRTHGIFLFMHCSFLALGLVQIIFPSPSTHVDLNELEDIHFILGSLVILFVPISMIIVSWYITHDEGEAERLAEQERQYPRRRAPSDY